MQQPSNKILGITVIVILLALYSSRKPTVNEIHEDDTSVSLCQVYVQYDASNVLNDQTLLSLLAIFKMHDFQIGQPVWGPSNILLYLCEHRLKTGLNQTIINKDLNDVIKTSGSTSQHLSWSCA